MRLPTAAGAAPVRLRLDRTVPYPAGQVRSVTLLAEGGRLWLEVTAEIPIATYPGGAGPDPGRVAGVDLGVIHPYAMAGLDGQGLLVSGRAIRAEHRMHLADTKARRRATAGYAPKRGQRGERPSSGTTPPTTPSPLPTAAAARAAVPLAAPAVPTCHRATSTAAPTATTAAPPPGARPAPRSRRAVAAEGDRSTAIPRQIEPTSRAGSAMLSNTAYPAGSSAGMPPCASRYGVTNASVVALGGN